MTQHKKCTKCGEIKPMTEFHGNGKNTHGEKVYRSSCKACEAMRDRARSQSNQQTRRMVQRSTERSEARWYMSLEEIAADIGITPGALLLRLAKYPLATAITAKRYQHTYTASDNAEALRKVDHWVNQISVQ